MPTFQYVIEGGLNTEAGPTVPTVVRDGSLIPIPWLTTAENIVYNADGWPQKMPGASNVNAIVTTAGGDDHVNGIFDYWRSGTGTSTTQQHLLYAGTKIFTEGSGILTSRRVGLEAAKMPWFEVMNDTCVIATSSSVDVPMTWDQTTFANLGGSPPAFKFMVVHGNYMFAAGVDSNKSRLYYSATNDQADWTSASAGSIDVSPDDGDVITGIRSHHGELIIFKGPNKGSIFRMTGTGEATWAITGRIRGVGATNQQAIIPRAGDLVFWDHFGIHSLLTTAAYGDYEPAFLSAPIAGYFNSSLNHSRFTFVWGANFASKSLALWTVSRSGAATNDLIIALDFRFTPPRFAFWPAYAAASLAMMLDTSQETVPWAGTYTGRMMRMNRSARNVGGVAYTGKVVFPYVGFTDPFYDKVVTKGRVSLAPKGDTSFTVGWQRDGNTQQTASVSQGGVPTLGPSSDQFILDSSVLGGGRYLPQFFDMEGSFKELQIELSQGSLGVDFEPHSFGLELEPAGLGTVATLG